MPSTQELTRRIKSVKYTRKITRAMQLVSAAKMRKSQQATLASRTYAQLAWELIHSLGNISSDFSRLLVNYPKASKLCIVLISTNKGLVGGFNANLLVRLRKITSEYPTLESEIIVIGRKGKEGIMRLRQNLVAEFPKHDSTQQVRDVYPIVTAITEAYRSGKYQKIIIVYNHFVSTLQQEVTDKQLLPFSEMDSGINDESVIYEPSKASVVKTLLPRILESQIYQAILESDASEHSARMVMMKNATESAGDLIDDLTLTFNQLRQNKITTELSEITAGKIALEG